jgi:hypothetical protein
MNSKKIIAILQQLNGHKKLIVGYNDIESKTLRQLLCIVNYSICLNYTDPKKLSSYDSATFLRTDLVELEETIPDGTCGYQALGLFLGISWLDVLQMVSTIWGESGRDDWRKLHHDLESCMENNLINLNCGGIDKKFWLRNEVLTALSKQQDVPILTFQKCQNFMGYVLIHVTGTTNVLYEFDILTQRFLVDIDVDSNREMILLELDPSAEHYSLLKLRSNTDENVLREVTWNIYFSARSVTHGMREARAVDSGDLALKEGTTGDDLDSIKDKVDINKENEIADDNSEDLQDNETSEDEDIELIRYPPCKQIYIYMCLMYNIRLD